MKRTRIISIMLIAIMCAVLLAGCSDKNESDLEYIKDKGTLVVGITDFAPMDYEETPDSGEWIGFDADMAKAFAKYLGVDVEFIEITWGQKHTELQTKAIDVVWNGMTLTDDVKALMGTSEPYCMNAQVVVYNKSIAADYTTVESLSGLTFAAEDESAGAEALEAEELEYTAVLDQATALMEVASGSAQACVIDLLMAGAMIGEGTNYPDLVTGPELTSEEYGVGFRQESDLIAEFNKFWKEQFDAGVVMETAEKYGIAKNIIEK